MIREFRAGSGPAGALNELAGFYFRTQVEGQAAGTIDAKRRDLQHFLDFYFRFYGHYRPAEWYPAVTRLWVKEMRHARAAPATLCRRYNTIRHFARWAHAHKPFAAGCPVEGVKAPEQPEADWGGLDRRNELRLIAAAETLRRRAGGGTRSGARDLALVHCLLGSGLRVSELLGLELASYDGRGFRDVPAKGGRRRRFVKLWGAEARRALEEWIAERGSWEGPLFATRTGKPMSRDQAFRILKRIERQANAHLPAAERFEATPHALRHTLLKKLADQRGVHVALKQSGHRSERYIWRYVQPNDEALAMADDDELE